MQKQIKMAAKLYECRDSAKSLAKMQNKDYKQMLEPYTEIIDKVMKANKLDHIPALLRISQTQIYQESAVTQLMFMAALVEMIEPSV